MATFGIPYAPEFMVTTVDGDFVAWVARCPVCGAFIELREKKDFESNTGSEYARHYEVEHARARVLSLGNL